MLVVIIPPLFPLLSHKPQTTSKDRAEAENKVVVGEVSDLIC